jgi:hypothetical protein
VGTRLQDRVMVAEGGVAAADAGEPGRVVEWALGKRSEREQQWADVDDFEWAPGSGLPCFMLGTHEEAVRRKKILRTSLLFMQLQKQVTDAVRWRHARDAHEVKVSAAIAAKHPVCFHDKETAQTEHEEAVTAASMAQVCPVVAVVSFEEKMKADAREAKVRMEAARLPAPLTQLALEKAYKEMPEGAEVSIQKCIKCWRENKMAPADLLGTVKSFASSSPTLRKVFDAAEHRGADELGQVATAEQMQELSRMAQAVATGEGGER